MAQLCTILSISPNTAWVFGGVMIISIAASLMGTVAFYQKRSLIGDAVAHAVLPGICLAFMVSLSKHPLIILAGAVAAGYAGIAALNYLTRHTKLKEDAALAVVLSVFFSLGVLLLSIIQGQAGASQAGLDKVLLGSPASLISDDIALYTLIASLIVAVLVVFYNPIQLILFNRTYAEARGFSVGFIDQVISLLTVLAVSIGIQVAGVVLMSALLIAPAVAARYWSHSWLKLQLLAALFAIGCSFTGTYISYVQPKMPTGPWIVIAFVALVLASALFGTQKGVFRAWLSRRKNRRKMLLENILKAVYQLMERKGAAKVWLSDLDMQRSFRSSQLNKGLRVLANKGLIVADSQRVSLTEKGLDEGRRLVRIHRLWELYLTKVMSLPSDHVHEDAEAIEHIITPELEMQLQAELDNPTLDPHNSPIP